MLFHDTVMNFRVPSTRETSCLVSREGHRSMESVAFYCDLSSAQVKGTHFERNLQSRPHFNLVTVLLNHNEGKPLHLLQTL